MTEQETPQTTKKASSSKKSGETASASQQSAGAEQQTTRPTDQQVYDAKQTELAAARDEHNQRAKTKYDEPSGTELADL